MRLSQAEVESIILALKSFIKSNNAKLFLFGSRVRDDIKGGDIDLLLLTNDDELADELLSDKHKMLASIKKKIGDQKIDLIIRSSIRDRNDNFLVMILPKAILLDEFRGSNLYK